MAIKVGAQDLMASLQKAGVPFGNAQAMQQATPGLASNIQTDLYANDPALQAMRNTFQSQLAQVAEMDKKLSSVYSDPNSPLFTNNIYAREKIVSGAHGTNSNAVRSISSMGRSRKSELDQQANEAVTLYRQLTAMQNKEEAIASKAVKSSGKKGTSQKVANSVGRTQQLKQQKWELAGLSDPDAIAVFERAPVDFQNQWVREYQKALASGDAGTADQQFYTADDVKGAWSTWDQKTAKPKASAASTAKIDTLKKSLGL